MKSILNKQQSWVNWFQCRNQHGKMWNDLLCLVIPKEILIFKVLGMAPVF